MGGVEDLDLAFARGGKIEVAFGVDGGATRMLETGDVTSCITGMERGAGGLGGGREGEGEQEGCEQPRRARKKVSALADPADPRFAPHLASFPGLSCRRPRPTRMGRRSHQYPEQA